jgi:hypothetical protein
MHSNLIDTTAGRLDAVGLEEMEGVRLMNRVDTKYIMSVHRLAGLLGQLDGKYRVLETGGMRIAPYSTCYLDDNPFSLFRQHIMGKPVRYKVRYRTYATTGATFLEVKKRTAASRTIKSRIPRKSEMTGSCDEKELAFLNSCLPFDASSLKPVLRNTFKRITLVDTAFRERATIDFDLSFSDNTGAVVSYPFIAIIELKREGYGALSPLAGVLRQMSVKPSGFSKYCVGISELYNIPGRKILREKISLIKRIENEYNSCCSA